MLRAPNIFSTLFSCHMSLVAKQNIEGRQFFNGIPVCICLLVAGSVGALKNKFPIKLLLLLLQDRIADYCRTGDKRCLGGIRTTIH